MFATDPVGQSGEKGIKSQWFGKLLIIGLNS